MPISFTLEFNNSDLSATHWRFVDGKIDSSGKCVLRYGGFKDLAAYQAGKKPLFMKQFSLTRAELLMTNPQLATIQLGFDNSVSAQVPGSTVI